MLVRWILGAVLVVFLLNPSGGRCVAGEGVSLGDGSARIVFAAEALGPARKLQQYLQKITGAQFPIEPPRQEQPGIYVGRMAEFHWRTFDRSDELGPEGFIIIGDGTTIYIAANELPGVQHAVATFLHSLGCRWFFPGPVWEILPEKAELNRPWNIRQKPSFPSQRRIWYGYGAYPENALDKEAWDRHNRMGGPLVLNIGHNWHGLNPDKDFAAHPDWFALTEGRRQPTKPCYSHPEVIRRAIETALAQAAKGQKVISMSPPDGLGYCECERCLSVFQGATPVRENGTLFAKRPDGVLVCIVSETFFRVVNEVARAVAAKYPDVVVGTYAYSAYSHPPSFDLLPNVFVQTTTAYRRTSLSREDQIAAFGKRARQVGIRDYYSVYQWDWDGPFVRDGALSLPRLVEDLRFFHRCGLTAINAEASNNWGPRGLGYYLAAQLMWDVNSDPKALLRDFYEKAFGPAARPIERYYARWYGPYVRVAGAKEASAASAQRAAADTAPADELGDLQLGEKARLTRPILQAAFRDLDEAAQRVANTAGCRERVDHLRMYLHYLVLRLRLEETARTDDRESIVRAVRDETVFGARLMNTNMIHSRPLIGKAFPRRFRDYMKYLEGLPEVAEGANKGFRQVREDVPTRSELEQLWSDDRRYLGLEARP